MVASMSDPSSLSRLEKLRVVREYTAFQLARLDETIRRLEVQEREDARRRERARIEQQWKIQPARTEGATAMLHRGGCNLFTTEIGYLSRDEALTALELEDPPVECCGVCQPETGLR